MKRPHGTLNIQRTTLNDEEPHMTASSGSLADLKINRDAPERGGLWTLLLVLLLLGGLAGGVWWWYTRPRPVEVRILTLEEVAGGSGTGKRTLLNASGYVVARRQATVSSKVTGKVLQVMVEEGMKVEAGQELARLDDANVQAALKLTTAQLEAVRATVKETGVRIAEAEKEQRRVQALAKNGIANATELDRVEADVAALRARLERQERDIVVAERQLDQVFQELADLVIKAPFAGIVTTKSAQPGEMISPVSAGGSYTRTGICTVVDMGSLEVEVDVSEGYINRVQAGQPVQATLDAYPEWRIPCKVLAIIPTADRQKATVKVRISFDALDPRLLPDMGVKVAFQAEVDREPAAAAAAATAAPEVRIPRTAVRQDGDKETVLVVQNEHVERRAIRTTDTGGSDLTVLAGLRAGERIVPEPPDTLKDGTWVKERNE